MSLTFNGVSSDSLGVIVERYPDRPVPERIVETVRVPGRNGTLTFSEGFANVRQDYDVYLSAEAAGLPSASAGMAAWLLAPEGYQKLTDTYSTTDYRMARLVNPQDVANHFNKFGRCTLSFDCVPQRYLNSGDTVTTYTTDATITNPTSFTALPMVYVTGSGVVDFALGGYPVTIGTFSGTIVLDCEAQNAYAGSINANNIITLGNGEFPRLEPGANSLTFGSGTITSIKVKPRWWQL